MSHISHRNAPTEVDHYQLWRVMDVYVAPAGEDLGRVLKRRPDDRRGTKLPANVRIIVRGSVAGHGVSFRSFGLGLILAIVLVYLILVAQFKSFLDPFLILLAVPTGLDRRADHPVCHGHHAQCHVADGHGDDGGHRRVQQHPDC